MKKNILVTAIRSIAICFLLTSYNLEAALGQQTCPVGQLCDCPERTTCVKVTLDDGGVCSYQQGTQCTIAIKLSAVGGTIEDLRYFQVQYGGTGFSLNGIDFSVLPPNYMGFSQNGIASGAFTQQTPSGILNLDNISERTVGIFSITITGPGSLDILIPEAVQAGSGQGTFFRAGFTPSTISGYSSMDGNVLNDRVIW